MVHFFSVYNATSRPSVVVLSDQEVFITWQKPLHLSGDLLHYELNINGKVIYSGLDTNYTVKTLGADETYEFMVRFIRLYIFGCLTRYLGSCRID